MNSSKVGTPTTVSPLEFQALWIFQEFEHVFVQATVVVPPNGEDFMQTELGPHIAAHRDSLPKHGSMKSGSFMLVGLLFSEQSRKEHLGEHPKTWCVWSHFRSESIRLRFDEQHLCLKFE